MKVAIVIFRNNLRVDDNASLYHACKENDVVLGLYSFEDMLSNQNYLGFKRYEIFKETFLKESLLSLEKNLKSFGVNLCYTNSIKASLLQLSEKYEIKLYFNEEVGVYEHKFEQLLKTYDYKSYFTQTMIEPFVFDYTKSFSHFRKKAEKQQVPKPLGFPRKVDTICFDSISFKIPIITKLKDAIFFKGGEDEAKNRLEEYMGFIHEYKTTRNEMLGFNNSSKFSPYLSFGTISPRTIYYRLKLQEEKTYESDSSYWLYFELLWRDFFHLVMRYSKNRLFLKEGLKQQYYNFKDDKKLLEDFFMANTKVDLIDASIKELKSTGWLSNRNRQLVASYFVKNLGLDWRYCAAFFESYLVDYNPASNYGNFAYQAFVGNDKTYRVFDIMKQSKMYNGKKYVRFWLDKEEQVPKVDYVGLANKTKTEVFNQ
jgi:deoxyribodipyrimidine photo-lyase